MPVTITATTAASAVTAATNFSIPFGMIW